MKEKPLRSPVELLHTKFEIPNLTYQIVRRNRLTSALLQNGDKRVSLIVAPPGYGKTTLLCEWLSFFSTSEHRSVWLTLDLFDNSPIRFWSYVIGALHKALPQFKFSYQNIHFLMCDSIDYAGLIPLINEIGKQPYYINLILDDFHQITDRSILDSLEFLFEHQPRNLHIIISSRTKPDLSLSKMRLSGRLVELTTKDLAFSKSEIDCYISNFEHLPLSGEQIMDLYQLTLGWPAGLQMAAIILANPLNYPEDVTFELLNRHEFPDYFSEEVLAQQDEETREFLLLTSNLDDFSPSLCNALLHIENSQEIIDQLMKNNLFISVVDSKQKWYRFHPLFAEALNKQLKKRELEQLPGLHESAMNWLIENGYPEKAVIYAIKTNDLQKAADIIDDIANMAISNHDVSKLILWIDANTDLLFEYRPRLGIYYAIALFLFYQFNKINAVIEKVEGILLNTSNQKLNEEDRKTIEWEIKVMRLSLELINGNYNDSVFRDAETILNDRTRESLYLYGVLTNTIGIIYDNLGELNKALVYFYRGMELAAKSNFQYGYWQTKSSVALCYFKQLKYEEAIQTFGQIIDFITQNRLDKITLLLMNSFLLEISLEQYDLQKADLLARNVIETLNRVIFNHSDWLYIVNYSLFIADYLVTKGDLTQARYYLEITKDNYPKSGYPGFLLPIEIIEVYVRLLRAEAQANKKTFWFVGEDDLINSTTLSTFTGRIAKVRILQDQNNHKGVIEYVGSFYEELNQSEYKRLKIEAQLLLSISEYQIGEKESAFSLIHEILQDCSSQNVLRVFLIEYSYPKDLFCEYLEWMDRENINLREIDKAFIEKIQQISKSKCAPSEHCIEATQSEVASVFIMNEPFSSREEEVYKLLLQGKGYKEIADSLVISMNTIRTHIKNIYRKLDIHSHKMLMSRAKELGFPAKRTLE